jgi:hypothetical protein
MKPTAANQQVKFEAGPYLIGFVLVGAGALLAFLGFAIGSLHSINQGIRWVRSWEQDPGDLAKMKWEKIKLASAASADAWKTSASALSAPASVADDGGQ